MSAKAVYNNKGLAIYITGDDFEQLLREWNIWARLHIGKTETRKSFVSVILSDEAQAEIANAYELECQAIDRVRNQAARNRRLPLKEALKHNRS